MIKKFIRKIKNRLFNKKDMFEDLVNYKKGEQVVYDEEVFNWFFNSD